MELKRYLFYGMAVFIISLIVSCLYVFTFVRGTQMEINNFTLLFIGAIGLAAGLIIVVPFFLADWLSIRKARQRYKRDS